MSSQTRTLSWDWYPGFVPENVVLPDSAYVETTHSFLRYKSQREVGARFGEHSSLYKTTMLDVGPNGCVTLGKYTLVQGARIICDEEVTIGDYAMVSWKVLIMDTNRWPSDASGRRTRLKALAHSQERSAPYADKPRPVTIGRNAWIGFESCLLPGVTIGEGAVVGARSIVVDNVDPFTIVAGNPARAIRRIQGSEQLPDRELSEFVP